MGDHMSKNDRHKEPRSEQPHSAEKQDVLARLGKFRGRLSPAQRLSREACHERPIDAPAEILELIEVWTGSYAQAVAWYDTEPLPSFGDVTAATLVRQGRADAVRAYIERIAEGGYA